MADETIKQKVLVEYEAKTETANNIASALAGPIAAKLDAIADKFTEKLKKGGEYLNQHITKVPGFGGIPEGLFGYENGISRTPAQAMASWFAAGGQTSHFQTSIYNRAALESSNVEVETKDGFPLIVHRLNQEWKDETEKVFRKLDAARKGLGVVEGARSASERIQGLVSLISPTNPHYVNSAYATLAANEMRSIARNKKLELDLGTRNALYSSATGLISAFGQSKDPLRAIASYDASAQQRAADQATMEANARIQSAVWNIVEGRLMDPDASAYFKHWAAQQNELAASRGLGLVDTRVEDEQNARIQNAMWNLTEGRKMDPEAKKYFQELYGKNTKSIETLNDTFNKFIMSGAWAYAIDKAATSYIGYRTATLTNTQTPFSQSILSGASVAGDIGTGLVAGGVGLAPFTGGWSLLASALGLGIKVGAGIVGSNEEIRQATWKRSRDMLKNAALYGGAVDYNYAQAVGQTGYISSGEVLGLNKTAAMIPGAMAFGAVGENEMWALSMMPNYWRGLMSGASTEELVDLFKHDLDRLPEAWRPYIGSAVPGGSENLRAFTNSEAYNRISRDSGVYDMFDYAQYPAAAAYGRAADTRIYDELNQENYNFLDRVSKISGISEEARGDFDRDARREDVAEGIRLGLERSKDTLREINDERNENITITIDGNIEGDLKKVGSYATRAL